MLDIKINLKVQTTVNYTGDLGVQCNLLLSKAIRRADIGIVNKISRMIVGFILIVLSLKTKVYPAVQFRIH